MGPPWQVAAFKELLGLDALPREGKEAALAAQQFSAALLASLRLVQGGAGGRGRVPARRPQPRAQRVYTDSYSKCSRCAQAGPHRLPAGAAVCPLPPVPPPPLHRRQHRCGLQFAKLLKLSAGPRPRQALLCCSCDATLQPPSLIHKHATARPAPGMRLHYFEWNSGGEDTVLLLHDVGEAAEVWATLAERLRQRGYRVYALDSRGVCVQRCPAHGASF